MIYVDAYDKEILEAVKKTSGITLRELSAGIGRPTPFRKRIKRLTEIGLIIVKEIPAKESPYSYRLNNTPRKTFYLNKKLMKELVTVENDRKNCR